MHCFPLFAILIFYIDCIYILKKDDSKVTLIINSYNQKQFSKIYAEFSSQLKNAITQQLFIQQLTTLNDRMGLIHDFDVISTGQIFCVCQTNLDTIVIAYLTNNLQQFTSFTISASPVSTFSFFKNNIDNNKVALSFSTLKGSLNINQNNFLTICSVYKITIVLEYSRQVAKGILNRDACIPIDYINRYYLSHIDTSHSDWLKTITGDCARLEDIVIGMIRYSSNANAEFLTDLVGIDNIDNLVTDLGMKHSKTIYIASSMLAMSNKNNLPWDDYIKYLKSITPQQLKNDSIVIHNQLKNKSIQIQDEFYLNGQIIDIHVELIQKSTTFDYLRLMQKINTGYYFQNSTQSEIYILFDNITKSSAFGKANYVHAGAKGGSANYNNMTNAVLAVAGYSQLTNGKNIQYSMITTGLTPTTFSYRSLDLNRFILALQLSQYFVVQFIKRINDI